MTANFELMEALQVIELQLREAQRQGRQRDRVELLLAAAEVHLRQRHEAKALRSLSLAIGSAAPGKLLYPFLCRERWLTPLLSQFKAKDFGLIQAVDLAFLDRLQAHMVPAAPADDDSSAAVGNSVGAEAPSTRERQLLSLLDQGLNNQQIADRLSLSLPTVKWHLRNLYAKLEVGSRSAALAKARSLSLLQR